MSYNMTPLVMHCTYPFPKEGIPCPACGRIQKKPSLFNLHAKNVHHTLAPETPTTCTGCGRQCRSYKAASAHYSRAHINDKKAKARSLSPASSQATSPPKSPSPTTTSSLPTPNSPNPKNPSSSLPLKLRKQTSPTCTPKQLSPVESRT